MNIGSCYVFDHDIRNVISEGVRNSLERLLFGMTKLKHRGTRITCCFEHICNIDIVLPRSVLSIFVCAIVGFTATIPNSLLAEGNSSPPTNLAGQPPRAPQTEVLDEFHPNDYQEEILNQIQIACFTTVLRMMAEARGIEYHPILLEEFQKTEVYAAFVEFSTEQATVELQRDNAYQTEEGRTQVYRDQRSQCISGALEGLNLAEQSDESSQ